MYVTIFEKFAPNTTAFSFAMIVGNVKSKNCGYYCYFCKKSVLKEESMTYFY